MNVTKEIWRDLKPCPFCGNKCWVMMCERLGKRYTVHCGNCGNGTGHWLNKQDAIAAWNRRTGGE